MLEEERKYEVGPGFVLPGLDTVLPAGTRLVPRRPATLTATYLDTPDLRLARAGVSLRHRDGDELPWTVKLPTGTTGIRIEVSRPGRPDAAPDAAPDDLVALVTAYALGAELAPAVLVRTVRRAYEVRDAADRSLAEIADDAVEVLAGGRVTATFRELEVERTGGGRDLLDRLEPALHAAGARDGGFVPKHVRALGPGAAGPPDLVPPGDLPARPTAGDVVTAAIRREVARVLHHDPLVRLGEPLPGGDTPVHQLRVGCRRLRSDLRTFAPLLAPGFGEPLRAELRWLAGVLGPARDAEVLRDRLRRTAAADPGSGLDTAAVDRLDALLARRQERALAGVAEALASPRHVALLRALVAAAREPRLTPAAADRAGEVLPRLVGKPWRRLVSGDGDRPGAGELRPLDPDRRWHAVRINAKRARYALDAVAPVLGGGPRRLAKALARVQTLLGEHQDAVVAGQTWLDLAGEIRTDHAAAVTAGRLFERERAAVRAARDAFPAAWHRATRPGRTGWLP
ncbi:CYTH and CHAD domain-containing protein [Plantactinospora sp. KBS50]|uniref:CYTH and CHAD domain-containing protein n=1 Tax=Plantactinospora sp. KBS50 TaxID=2024580 RepID=UPI000BAAEE77|nr:CYTH and CHAD domain-containing protein [Plantactinospora sp. KBS50]ASW53969.1 CHAD domain containing protein [Plantactinospora sp. KBS50]